jgi:tetratricopeptide (TPR) repeat protein
MNMWVQRCPHCDYCAPSIEEGIDGANDLIGRETYKAQLGASDYPELARNFLCCSMLLENAGDYAEAGRFAHQAAWACDDNQAVELAIECRLKAFDFYSKAREQGQVIIEEGEEAFLADILRRSGRFEQAMKFCNEGLKKAHNEMVISVLKFEMELIKRKNIQCYTVENTMI